MSKNEAMKEFFSDEDTKSLAKICAEANCGMRYTWLTSSRLNRAELFFTSSDLKSFVAGTNVENNTSNREFLHMMVQEAKKELPKDVAGGMIMTDIYLTSFYFVIEYNCPDDAINLMRESLKQKPKEHYMQYAFKGEIVKLFAKMCADADYGFRVICTNKERTNNLEMSYSAEELKNYLK